MTRRVCSGGARTRLLAASVYGACIACATLKLAPEATTNELPDGNDGGAEATVDAAIDAPHVPAPPPDFACPNPWTKNTVPTPTGCNARQVRVIDALPSLGGRNVAIARTPSGRVGVAFNHALSASESTLRLFHFKPETPAYEAPTKIERATGSAFHDGFSVKLKASAPDTLALLSFDLSDTSNTGDVYLRSLVSGQEPLTESLMATGVRNPTEIALASDTDGTVYAAVRVALASDTKAKLIAATKPSAGPFVPLQDIATGLVTNIAPGVGQAFLTVDDRHQVHVLYHFANAAGVGTLPRYQSLAGTGWTSPKTTDINYAMSGVDGFNPCIAVFGKTKYAAFYSRKAGQGATPTAELRLATWQSDSDVPQIEVLDQDIPSTSTGSDPPDHQMVMAVDAYGLVHITAIRPNDSSSGVLEYQRQVRKDDGTKTWMHDIVDPDVLGSATASVDMVVDEHARPHIAYRSGKTALVMYATRFDR